MTTKPVNIQINEGYLLGADGNKIFYRETGTGDADETIVYLHGGPGFDMHDGGYELDPLAQNYRIINYDQRGGGYSEEIKDPIRLGAVHHVEDVEAVRQHFGLGKITLMGMSWGSGLAILYANKYPQNLHRIILLAPMPMTQVMMDYRMVQTTKLLTEQEKKTFAEVRNEDLTNATDEQIIANCRLAIPIMFKPYMSPVSDWKNMKGDLCGSDPQGMKRRWANYAAVLNSIAGFDWTEDATRYEGPVYVLDGEWSSVPLNTTREWAGYLPNSRVELIKSAGHIAWLDNPTAFFDSVEAFMQGQWPQHAHVLNPTHLDLLARYSFLANLKNDMDNRFDGEASGNITFTSDRFGNDNSAAAFGEQDDRIVITTPDWIAQPKNWSWTGWCKVNQQIEINRTLLSQGLAQGLAQDDAVTLKLQAAKLHFGSGECHIEDPNAIAQNTWFHIGVVQDGDSINLYRDGKLAATASSANLAIVSGDFTMQNHLGALDDVRIYAQSLSEAQILAVYHDVS